MNLTKPIRVLLVDDHPALRAGLSAIIGTQPDIAVIAESSSGSQAIDMFRQHKPDVTLMDLRLPGMSGVEAITAIRQEFTESRFIVLTSYDGDEDIYRALQAGAKAFLLKDMVGNELLDAIRAVHAGHRRIPPAVASRLADRMARPTLTARELEVIELIAQGKSNKEIAWILSIVEDTVKGHVSSLLMKLDVHDRTQAAVVALKRGVIHIKND